MLVPSTGIASSISCRVDCTEVTASISRGELAERGDGQVEARVGLPVGGRSGGGLDLGVRALQLLAAYVGQRQVRGELGGARLDDPPEVEGVEPVPAPLRGDPRGRRGPRASAA